MSWDNAEILNKVKILVPGVSFKNVTKQGPSRSIPVNQKLVPKRKSVFGCDKQSPVSGPLWEANRTKFPALYKALVGVPDELHRKEKRDLRACVLRASTSVKRARRLLHTYDSEGCPLVTQ